MQKIKKFAIENGRAYALISKVLTDPDTGEEHVVSTHHANIDLTDPAQVIHFPVEEGVPVAPPMPVVDIIGQVTAQAIMAREAAEAARDATMVERDAMATQLNTVTAELNTTKAAAAKNNKP